MKKILVLLLTVTLFLSTIATLPAAAAANAHFSNRGVYFRGGAIARSTNVISLNKKTLTLKKGKSSTLKFTLDPVIAGATVKWQSSNEKIAKVSSSGKVTAVAPGTAWIGVGLEGYNSYNDGTGFSNECFVTVQGGSKDPKPLGSNDRTFSYNTKKFTVPDWSKSVNYYNSLVSIKNKINNHNFDYLEGPGENAYYIGIAYYASSAYHTDIYYVINADSDAPYGFGVTAYSAKSPIKTNRGIKVGGTRSAVTKAYGLPTWINAYKDGGVNYEEYVYQTYSVKSGKALYMNLIFAFQKSKSGVLGMSYYYGLLY
jgi:hypothetical protein